MSSSQHPEHSEQNAPEQEAVAVETQSMETVDMIYQLRLAVLLVGGVALVTSLMLNWFIFMVNNGYADQLNQQRQQLINLSQNYQRYDTALRELMQLAPSKPSMVDVLRQYGLSIGNAPPPSTLTPPPAADFDALPPATGTAPGETLVPPEK
jgi:hypothetical protein